MHGLFGVRARRNGATQVLGNGVARVSFQVGTNNNQFIRFLQHLLEHICSGSDCFADFNSSDWWENDGLVPTYSQMYPHTAGNHAVEAEFEDSTPVDQLQAGKWNFKWDFDMDHLPSVWRPLHCKLSDKNNTIDGCYSVWLASSLQMRFDQSIPVIVSALAPRRPVPQYF